MERMNETLRQLCASLVEELDQIPEERKQILQEIKTYIHSKEREQIQLISVCTHNSRRSHFGQVGSMLAATYFGKTSVYTYSAGTETTAVHPNTITALKEIGCEVSILKNDTNNPTYRVSLSSDLTTDCFSKTIDHPTLPKQNFVAIMTCTDAEQNCPFLPGADLRISTPYSDPKSHDNTPQALEKYVEKMRGILREWLFVFEG